MTNKLDLTLNTLNKTKKSFHIMAKLHVYHLGVTEKLIKNCYNAFIDSIIVYHLVVLHNYINTESREKLKSVIKAAECLSGKLTFTPLEDLYSNRLKVRCLHIITSGDKPLPR